MRSLALKLTLAFLLVGLTGSLVVAGLVQVLTQREFGRYVLNTIETEFVADLASYYEANESWEGLQEALDTRWFPRPEAGMEPHRQFERLPVVVVDQDGIVVYGPMQLMGQPLTFNANSAVPIETEQGVTGWVVLGFPQEPWQQDTPEGEFAAAVNRSILYGAVIATLLALLIGTLLARTITHPIRELRTATQIVAGGDLGYQVKVRARDELGQLADSFNRMSADLAHSSNLRRQMTADIAHDLRTPLSVLLGYTEALSEHKLDASDEVYHVMHDEAKHLQRLIEDLRTLSLADAGELPLMRQEVSAEKLLERVAAAHQPFALQKEIAIQVHALPEIPALDVDPDRMTQVLGNLVSNALRYTPEGGTIQLVAEGEGSQVVIRVIDNGVGISAEELPFVFERFYRADQSRHLQEGESGLGLSIARSIVEAHGGTIAVESVRGQGTTFTIKIPAEATP